MEQELVVPVLDVVIQVERAITRRVADVDHVLRFFDVDVATLNRRDDF